ncbi:MAG: LytR/AlgR family response regulator transcription factor [Lachnospiraceae bacterium]
MITIAVCDDSEAVVTNLSKMLELYAKEAGQNIKIYKFNSGLKLLEQYTGNYDIIFLDIKMPYKNGLETAGSIRKRDRGVSIIFLTSLVHHALDGYRVQALSYIIKPISYKRLKIELEDWIYKQSQDQEPFIVIKNDNGNYKVLLKDLAYIETSNRNALVHTKSENIICYKKLKILETELNNHGFSRCHSSYIVNLAYIENIEKMDAKLITGEVVPISQTKRKDFMQRLARYWGERI